MAHLAGGQCVARIRSCASESAEFPLLFVQALSSSGFQETHTLLVLFLLTTTPSPALSSILFLFPISDVESQGLSCSSSPCVLSH